MWLSIINYCKVPTNQIQLTANSQTILEHYELLYVVTLTIRLSERFHRNVFFFQIKLFIIRLCLHITTCKCIIYVM